MYSGVASVGHSDFENKLLKSVRSHKILTGKRFLRIFTKSIIL
jgi:hypothetical protein